MLCSKCREYNHGLRRCSRGKVRAKSVKQGVEIAQIMGISYLCQIDTENANIVSRIQERMTC